MELLDGEIVAMAPQSNSHARAARWLRIHLTRGVDPVEWLVGSHEPIGLSEWSEPEPDVRVARSASVVEDSHPGVEAMTLVVEVSWSSSAIERLRTTPLYGGAGVPEYWIVDLHRAVAYVHRAPAGDGYREVSTAMRGDVCSRCRRPT